RGRGSGRWPGNNPSSSARAAATHTPIPAHRPTARYGSRLGTATPATPAPTADRRVAQEAATAMVSNPRTIGTPTARPGLARANQATSPMVAPRPAPSRTPGATPAGTNTAVRSPSHAGTAVRTASTTPHHRGSQDQRI